MNNQQQAKNAGYIVSKIGGSFAYAKSKGQDSKKNHWIDGFATEEGAWAGAAQAAHLANLTGLLSKANKDLQEAERKILVRNALLNDVADVMEAFEIHGEADFSYWTARCRGQTDNLPEGFSFKSLNETKVKIDSPAT